MERTISGIAKVSAASLAMSSAFQNIELFDVFKYIKPRGFGAGQSPLRRTSQSTGVSIQFQSARHRAEFEKGDMTFEAATKHVQTFAGVTSRDHKKYFGGKVYENKGVQERVRRLKQMHPLTS